MRKIILITGITSGLGHEVAKLLSSNHLVYGGLRDTNDLTETDNIKIIKLDVTSDKDCAQAIKMIIKMAGRIDVLLNIAGYTVNGPTSGFSSADFENILQTNTIGPFRLMKYVVPQMKKQKSGYIINITSINGLVPLPNFGLYSASKHALQALGSAFHYELKNFGINVVNIAPGAVYSEIKSSKQLSHKPAREKFKMLYFLMPMVTKEKIANVVENIISMRNPPSEIVLGTDAKIMLLLKKILPIRIWDFLMQFVWNKK